MRVQYGAPLFGAPAEFLAFSGRWINVLQLSRVMNSLKSSGEGPSEVGTRLPSGFLPASE